MYPGKKQDTCIIKKGVDQTKDQSYMLWRLNQHQLSHIKFPLGGYHKRDIKKMGSRYFPFLKGKPESQDICFISPRGYQHYLADKFKAGEGNILNSQGRVLGRHKGYPYYTIGQRKGLGISHTRPLYVKKIIAEQNAVVVGEKEELLQKEFRADQLNFLTGNPPSQKFRAQIMIRYNFKPAPATIELLDLQCAKCCFDVAQLAIAPGQSAVFYQDDLLLGGGIIT
ncbi:MAG: tRNA methyl transferase PRC-barrel domain-containing protein [Actinomycetota bacterium]|nr:tRNA methyl transferase PRC-barrel domain-containing protein [Actinomycetota bacterium]